MTDPLAFMHRHAARDRLQTMVDARRNSFECEQYRRRRAAAKLGIQRKAGA